LGLFKTRVHGDWDLDIGFNGVRTMDIAKELKRVETLPAYSRMACINNHIKDTEPEDFMVEHNQLHHHAETSWKLPDS
jgi:hypothetical protein